MLLIRRNANRLCQIRRAHTQCDELHSAIDQLEQQHRPNCRTAIISLVRRCSASDTLSTTHCSRLQECVSRLGYAQDVLLQNLLIHMFGKCGAISDAAAVFDRIPEKNTFSWNILIAAYSQNGHLQEAVDVFQRMPSPDIVSWNTILAAYARNGHTNKAYHTFHRMVLEGVSVDIVTLVTLIDMCSSSESLSRGRSIHRTAKERGLETDEAVGAALINMYVKCGELQEAVKIFDRIPRRNVVMWTTLVTGYAQNGHPQEARRVFMHMPCRNIVTWNAIITAYARNGHPHDALTLFFEMDRFEITHEQITVVAALDACATTDSLHEGCVIHERVRKNHALNSDSTVRTALVNMYSKCGRFERANEVFEECTEKEVSLCRAMVAASARAGYIQKACGLLDKIQPVLDVIHFNILITAFGESGHIEQAERLFRGMKQDTVSWNSMIGAYSLNGNTQKALRLFAEMDVEGLSPTSITLVHVLEACTQAECELLYEVLASSEVFHRSVMVQTALVNMLARCGKLEEAETVFNGMRKPNVVTWNSMITAYAQTGQYRKALETFCRMDLEGIEATKVTFVSVLHACADIGAIREGKEVLSFLDLAFLDSEPSLATAVVDMYAKCGMVNEAREVFNRGSARDAVSWSAIIAAYTRNEQPEEALDLFNDMNLEGVHPNDAVLNLVISASSHAGLLKNGCESFYSISEHYNMRPTLDHYGCVVDLLARAGKLVEAEELLNTMPFEPGLVEWTTLFSACSVHGDAKVGMSAAVNAARLDPENAGNYVMLYNICKAEETSFA